jgi:hypothetical protein
MAQEVYWAALQYPAMAATGQGGRLGDRKLAGLSADRFS